MTTASRNGLIIGVTLGAFLAWQNYPAGAELTDARLARTLGQVLGTTLVVWLIALAISGRKA